MEPDGWNNDEDGDAETTIPCPYCRRPMYDESERCPHCGNYISDEETVPTRRPWWIVLGVLLALYVVYRWIVG